MTVTIEISDLEEQELRITAEANDLTLEAYITEIVRREALEDAADRADADHVLATTAPEEWRSLDDLRTAAGDEAISFAHALREICAA